MPLELCLGVRVATAHGLWAVWLWRKGEKNECIVVWPHGRPVYHGVDREARPLGGVDYGDAIRCGCNACGIAIADTDDMVGICPVDASHLVGGSVELPVYPPPGEAVTAVWGYEALSADAGRAFLL
jgi:hypothetical protein